MPLERYPLIKLEIEEMKHSVLHHFNSYQQDLSKCVKQEIDRAINGFDFEGAVRESAHAVIKDAIESYFKYGEGRTALNEIVSEILNRLFKIDKKDTD